MNIPVNPASLATNQFGIGQPVRRTEDPVLVQGHGRYADDVNLPGQVYLAMVRSPYAHGIIRGIDTEAAREMPGVLGVYTGADLQAAGYGPFKCNMGFPNRDGSPMHKPARFALALDKVRFVGDPIAFVVAETAAQAKDAAEAVMPDIDSLPAVTSARAAIKGGAPLLYDDAPGNQVLDFHYGDAEKIAQAFAAAAHVTRLSLLSNRVVVCPMEPRCAAGLYDSTTGRWTLHVSSQGVFNMREQVRDVLGVAADKLRIVTGHVGGSFGMKATNYPEYICLLHAARQLGRPVKWTDERSSAFMSDYHGRDHDVEAELALDKDGKFLAVRVTNYCNIGAYLTLMAGLPGSINIVKNSIGVYRTPLIEVIAKLVVTNTTPISAYRGAGRPESNYYMERLIETAALEMKLDPLQLRRRNHIQSNQFPYEAPSGVVYDSGDFPAILDEALQVADWDGFAARKAESKARGKLRGRGIGHYLEATAPPGKELGEIRFEADGTVTIVTGTLDYGQGHASPFAQILSERLGVPFDRIRLFQGDSDKVLIGGGTGGSRSAMASGGAIVEASDQVIERGKQLAGFVLEAAAADIEFGRGRFSIVGTDRGIGIMELADKLRAGLALPADLPQGLDVQHVHQMKASAFPNGCHIAEVEVDPETGVVDVVRYHTVNDFGTIINPLMVEGQVHGGIAQGIGQALMESVVYDEAGQLLTGSYMDYALPRASDTPNFSFRSHPVPAKTNPLGIKGCGEAGCAGSLPSVMNALVNALSEYGIRHIDMPATPQHVWRTIQEARAAGARLAG